MNLFYVQNSKDQNRHLLPLLFIYSCNIYIYKQVATVATLYTLKTKFTPLFLPPMITMFSSPTMVLLLPGLASSVTKKKEIKDM